MELNLEEGDILLLYTDGVNEASDIRGEEFGTDRLNEILANTSNLGAEKVIKAIENEVISFSGDVPQNDDITLIALEKI